MLKLHNTLKAATLSLATIFCACLAAEDTKVAVANPRGGMELKEELKLVKDSFSSTITKTRGFQVFDRANTDQIMEEHDIVRNSGLFGDAEARNLGEFEGADFVIVSELTKLSDGAIRIIGQALDIKTARVVGSENKVVPTTAASKLIMDTCQDLMEGLLKQVNISLSGRNATNMAQSIRDDMSGEIKRLLMNNRSNAKWNTNKSGYSLEVDLSGMTITENRQHGTSRVTGRIYFTLTDSKTSDSAQAELELTAFTEMNKELIQKKIREQVQKEANKIIRDLLSDLD
jgi:hypothetical protein